jgi:Replication initiator protein A (RepA) N-terminus
MSEYYTVNEMYGEKFYQVPKVFFTNPLYKKGLTDTQKLAFGLLRDRFSLSVKNKWFDDQGRIYFIFSQESLMEIFDCSKQTASNIKKKLVRVGLLEIKKNGQGQADWLYLKKPIVTDEDIYEIDKAESLGAVEKSKNKTSKSLENRRLEVQKIDANDTDLSNTDFNNLEEEESQSELISFLLTKDITLENAVAFETRLIEEAVTGYENDDVLEALRQSFVDFKNGVCNSPYLWAVRKLKYILDSKTRATIKKPTSKQKKPTRTEKLPDWFDKDEKQSEDSNKSNDSSSNRSNNEEKDEAKRKIEEQLKELSKQKGRK